MTRIVSLSLLLSLFAFFGESPAQGIFEDKNLEKVVRQYVFAKRNNEQPLTAEDVETISTIVGKGEGIKSLKGLENCLSLALLDLENNEIADIAPVKELTTLQSLNLAGNQIEDIQPVAPLKKLQYLELSRNKIKQVEPLAELTALRSLYLSGNEIAKLEPLAKLTKLWSLYVGDNQIQDLKPIAELTLLTSLDARGNKIADLAPLAKLTELRFLLLSGNPIKDLGPVVEMVAADAKGAKRFAPYLEIYLIDAPLSQEAREKQVPALRQAVRKVVLEAEPADEAENKE